MVMGSKGSGIHDLRIWVIHGELSQPDCQLPVANPTQAQGAVSFFNFVPEGTMRLLLGGGFKYVLCSPRKLRKIPILTHIFQMGYIHQPVFQRICWYHDVCRCLLGGMDFWTNSIGFRPEPLFRGWVSHHFERPTSRVVETAWLDEWCWEFPKMFWLVGLALNTSSCFPTLQIWKNGGW